MDPTTPISPVQFTAISPADTESTFAASPIKAEDRSTRKSPKKKQKRNKPTLSCEECVERKTKASYAWLYLRDFQTHTVHSAIEEDLTALLVSGNHSTYYIKC